MTWQEACDLAGAISILLGAVLALVGAIGLVRLPDIFARMHRGQIEGRVVMSLG